MKVGDEVWIRVFKADGEPYRWWRSVVEEVRPDCIITHRDVGTTIYQNGPKFREPVFNSRWIVRDYFWPGRRHDLLEVYAPDGQLEELYADITSPIEIVDDEIRYIDHELDVQMLAGGKPCIVDQDEFAEAAVAFGYSEAFVSESYTLAEQLVELLAGWTLLGPARRAL